jgi:hypothetical protein
MIYLTWAMKNHESLSQQSTLCGLFLGDAGTYESNN